MDSEQSRGVPFCVFSLEPRHRGTIAQHLSTTTAATVKPLSECGSRCRTSSPSLYKVQYFPVKYRGASLSGSTGDTQVVVDVAETNEERKSPCRNYDVTLISCPDYTPRRTRNFHRMHMGDIMMIGITARDLELFCNQGPFGCRRDGGLDLFNHYLLPASCCRIAGVVLVVEVSEEMDPPIDMKDINAQAKKKMRSMNFATAKGDKFRIVYVQKDRNIVSRDDIQVSPTETYQGMSVLESLADMATQAINSPPWLALPPKLDVRESSMIPLRSGVFCGWFRFANAAEPVDKAGGQLMLITKIFHGMVAVGDEVVVGPCQPRKAGDSNKKRYKHHSWTRDAIKNQRTQRDDHVGTNAYVPLTVDSLTVVPFDTCVDTAAEGCLVLITLSTSQLSNEEWHLIQHLFPRQQRLRSCMDRGIDRVRLDTNGIMLGHQSDLSTRVDAPRQVPRGTSSFHQLTVTQVSVQLQVVTHHRIKEGFTGHLLTGSYAGPVRIAKLQGIYDRCNKLLCADPKDITKNQIGRAVLEPCHASFKTFFCEAYIPGSFGGATSSSRFLVMDNNEPVLIAVVREAKRGWSRKQLLSVNIALRWFFPMEVAREIIQWVLTEAEMKEEMPT